MKMTGNSVRSGFEVILFSLLLVFCFTGVQASAQDYSACERIFTNANQLAGVFGCDIFAMPTDSLNNRAWLINPQFLWADFATLPEQFAESFAQSLEQVQGVTVLKLRLTRFLLDGETLVEFPASTNTLALAAPANYATNQVDSASRSALSTWRQWISWGEIDANTTPTLSIDVALADILDKPAYDAAQAAAEAACEQSSALSLRGGLFMSQSEETGGNEFGTESVTPCVSNTVSSIRATPDQTMVISWCSDDGGLYEIDSADSLTSPGAQGLKWVIRENGFPSKGTGTQWMDVGDPLWLSPILPPRFRQMRFYRIGKVGQATLTPPPTVALQLTQTNAILGDLYAIVNVALNDTNQQVSSVSVFVDGQKLIYTTYTNFTAFINSCEWPNGPHEIYAVATTVDGGETLPDCDGCAQTNSAKIAIGVSPSVAVTFSNYVSQLFVAVPFFDPAAGQTQQVVATFPESTCWRLTVLDYQDAAVRHYTNRTSSSLFVAWDGKDDGGNPLPFGFYDYYIEARPSRFGCPSGSFAAMESTTNSSPSPATAKAGVYSRAAMQFSRRVIDISQNVAIPDLTPSPGSDGSNSEQVVEALDFGDTTYSTRTTTRVAGTLFMGKAGYVGVGYQGHHPSSPNFALPNGGVISLSHPPYGKLVNASVIANNFASVMAASAWQTSFNLGDDNFNSTNLFPVLGTGSGTSAYAAQCHFGLYVGHMTATANIDSDCACYHSWIPVYNSQQPGAYQWIGLPFVDLGKPNGSSPLKWMAFYGCNSLREQDWNDMWTKFVLPMPPNLRLLLGAEDGVFIHPRFGWQFAADMNGLTTPNNIPMTIVESWYDAARVADQLTAKQPKFWLLGLGTRRMTVAWRDDFEGGTWRTIDDSIWNWSSDISYDWTDIYLDERQVYP